ncbi:MAG: folate family ECF transporter S component [Clostridia bacterium]|nr:folate family ECF transporter S component [Clostridia bacterium]
MSKNKKIILSAMLLALLIVLSRFLSIETQFLVLSFSFIPIMMSAIWLGPKYSMMIAALGDLIGALLFPFGAYFPGFTLSAAISGLIYGLFLYNKNNASISNIKFLLKLIISSILVLGLVNIFITSFWLHMLYGKAYLVIISTRAVSQLIMLPIQVTIIYILNKLLNPIFDKYLMQD